MSLCLDYVMWRIIIKTAKQAYHYEAKYYAGKMESCREQKLMNVQFDISVPNEDRSIRCGWNHEENATILTVLMWKCFILMLECDLFINDFDQCTNRTHHNNIDTRVFPIKKLKFNQYYEYQVQYCICKSISSYTKRAHLEMFTLPVQSTMSVAF